jgi:ATP-dependent DNA ligase
MEADPATELPSGRNWQYEPKWDGFRCLAFRDGSEVELESKSQKPLTRYFPELAGALRLVKTAKFVLDGEIVIAIDGKLSFDNLLMRIHPAASRVQKLSIEEPSLYVVFDLLVDERGKSLVGHPLRDRRTLLEKFAARYLRGNKSIKLCPRTDDISVARKWFSAGTGLDGIVAKRTDLPYQTGKRTGMEKIKRRRTAECVVGGFRYLQKEKQVGSLLLGLYNEQGKTRPHRLLFIHCPRRAASADQDAGKTYWAARLHRQIARWAKPMEHKRINGVGAAKNQTGS